MSTEKVAQKHGIGKTRCRDILLANGVVMRPPKSKGARQLPTPERQMRINAIVRLLITGLTDLDEMLATVTSPKGSFRWEVARTTLIDYRTEAWAILKKRVGRDRDELVSLADARDEDLYRRALQANDIGAAIKAHDGWKKTHGLFAPTKSEIGGNDGKPIQVTWKMLTDAEAERIRDD